MWEDLARTWAALFPALGCWIALRVEKASWELDIHEFVHSALDCGCEVTGCLKLLWLWLPHNDILYNLELRAKISPIVPKLSIVGTIDHSNRKESRTFSKSDDWQGCSTWVWWKEEREESGGYSQEREEGMKVALMIDIWSGASVTLHSRPPRYLGENITRANHYCPGRPRNLTVVFTSQSTWKRLSILMWPLVSRGQIHPKCRWQG